MMQPVTHKPRRLLFLLAGVIVAPALVLAILSWRSLRQEREERRGELLRRASTSAQAALRELEAEINEIRDRAWRKVGETSDEIVRAGSRGGIVCLRGTRGDPIYPKPLEIESPSLEELVRRENPSLLQPLANALDLEFAKGRPREASERYSEVGSLVESASVRAALLHAQGRAALRAGRADEAREIYRRLAREAADATAESGLPYEILAQARLLALEPATEALETLLQAMAGRALPGHARALLLRDALATAGPLRERLGRELAAARALERLEEILGRDDKPRDEIVRLEGRAFLLARRALPAGLVAAAIPLDEFPGRQSREALRESEGIVYDVQGFERDPARGEALLSQISGPMPSLAVSARLVDPSRLEIDRGRLFLTGGILICLVAALFFGITAMLRTVRHELAVAQLKGDFVSGVSHELKTPLTSIRMFAEMLESGRVANDEKVREYHRLIHRESLRLSRLVENVLDFARIEEGRKTFSFAERPLGEVVVAALETFRALADGQRVELRTDLAGDPLVARVDADALSSAVLNLLDNALKYGGDPRQIEVRLARRGDAAEISVKDNGPGIPLAERGRIFEKFYRGAAAARGPAGGAGLGLALVKHAIEAHGGSVSVESEPGQGSRFILTLPLCRGSSS